MYALLTVLFLAAYIGALVDIITRPDGHVQHLPKVVWILLVVFLPLIGSVLWFTIGRGARVHVERGGFGDPRRSDVLTLPPEQRRTGQARSTEEELAALDREIEFHQQQDRIRRLEAELEERRKQAE